MANRHFTINLKDLLILQQIISDLKKNNVEVCLFVAPYLPNYRSKISNLDLLIEYIAKETELPVIDLSKSLTKPDYFVDRVHTNDKGAILIANLLMKSTHCQGCR